MQVQAQYRSDYKSPDFTVSEIFLDIELDAKLTEVRSVLNVQRLNPQAQTLRLDGHSFQFLGLTFNGQPFNDFRQEKEALIINVPPQTEQFTLEIKTHLNPAQNTSLQGLYLSGDCLCTQCEAQGFRQITYMLDRPDVLAKYRTKITADKAQYPYLLSNGNRVAAGDLDNARHWVEWEDPFNKPSYLFALVAGDFDLLQDEFITRSGRRVALEIFVDRGNLSRADWAMKSLKRAMKWDEDRFGLEYDLDIYMIVAVDFFNMGAMENKGLNVFNAKYVLASPETATDKDYLDVESVIAHEYFHNWTGNRITCRDWFQLSLKEGLTVFRDQEFTADLWSRPAKRIEDVRLLRNVQFAEDASPMSHPIRPEKVIEMNNFYTVTVYEKGAEVIRMIHTLLGEEKFQRGMKKYITDNDGKAATCEDFVRAMEQASGVDLHQFRHWYSQSGTPELTVNDEYNPQTKTYRLHISQQTPPTADQLDKANLHIPVKIALYGEKGNKISLIHHIDYVSDILEVRDESQTFEFHSVAEKPVPALLCDFSAPVKLYYPYTNAQKLTLLKYADNEFIRWDIAQQLFVQELRDNLLRLHQYGADELRFSGELLEALRHILDNALENRLLTSLMLTMPKEPEFAEYFKVIDPDGIAIVRRFMLRSIAEQLQDSLLACYQQNQVCSYEVNAEDMAKRALRNACLSYLAFTEQGSYWVNRHYQQSDNMTDTLAALSAAIQAKLHIRDNLLHDFEEKWHHDGLVMDKWFALQASRPDENVLEIVEELMGHRSFNFTNPNRVRALVGTFAQHNPKAFHNLDGSGYRFLVDVLVQLNQSNPQVAARLIEPLIKPARFDAQRQMLIKRSLERLASLESLSKDLFEKIEKALQ